MVKLWLNSVSALVLWAALWAVMQYRCCGVLGSQFFPKLFETKCSTVFIYLFHYSVWPYKFYSAITQFPCLFPQDTMWLLPRPMFLYFYPFSSLFLTIFTLFLRSVFQKNIFFHFHLIILISLNIATCIKCNLLKPGNKTFLERRKSELLGSVLDWRQSCELRLKVVIFWLTFWWRRVTQSCSWG